jgi:hypothetical protein
MTEHTSSARSEREHVVDAFRRAGNPVTAPEKMAAAVVDAALSASAVETFAAVRPFRVQWRPDLTCGWLLLGEDDTREDADLRARDAIARFKGYCRILEQKTVQANESHGRWSES